MTLSILLVDVTLQEAVSMSWLPTKQKAWRTAAGSSKYIPNSGDSAAAFHWNKYIIVICKRGKLFYCLCHSENLPAGAVTSVTANDSIVSYYVKIAAINQNLT